MVALCNRADHNIFMPFLLSSSSSSSSFFPRLISFLVYIYREMLMQTALNKVKLEM